MEVDDAQRLGDAAPLRIVLPGDGAARQESAKSKNKDKTGKPPETAPPSANASLMLPPHPLVLRMKRARARPISSGQSSCA